MSGGRYMPAVRKVLIVGGGMAGLSAATAELLRRGTSGRTGGQFAEALRAFKKIYLEIVDRLVDHLEAREPRL